MTLADNYVPTKTLATGSQTVFTFSWTAISASFVKVLSENVATGVQTEITSGFTTVLDSDGVGGTITFVSAPGSVGTPVYIIPIREVPKTQETAYSTSTGFPATTVETNFSTIVAMAQENAEIAGRALTYPIGTSGTVSAQLPVPVAGKTIKGNSTATGWELTVVDPDEAATYAAASAASAVTAASAASAAQTAQGLAEDAQDAAEAAAASVPSIATVLAAVMPVGFVVTLGVSTNPATLYGFGTWSAIAGRVIVGINAGDTEFDTLNETGGAKTHTLSVNEIPAHDHRLASISTFDDSCSGFGESRVNGIGGPLNSDPKSVSFYSTDGRGHDLMESTGGGLAHNNLQPYIVKYVWERTA